MNLVKDIKSFGFSPVSSMISSSSELFKLPYEEICKIKTEIIKENFSYHFEKNEFYRDVCKQKDVTPDDINSFEDLIKIPLIPVRTFKEANSHHLLSCKLSEIEFEMRSTGTSGIPSVSRRDSKTIDYATEGIVKMYREFFKISKGVGMFLFPPTEEMPEMGMIKVLNITAGLFDGTRNMVKKVSFNPQEAVEVLQSWEGKHVRNIVGPPFLIYKLLSYMIDNDIKIKLDKKSLIITLGGWKKFTGKEIPRNEFNALCAEYLGMNPNNVRDMYGLVEANMLAIECEQQEKHLPPWVHISVRNPRNVLEEVNPGERGVVAIYDPTSLSYPGYILTEDVGYIKTDMNCECGRVGQKLTYISRIPGVEVGCCAINLEKYIEENESKRCPDDATPEWIGV
ncbi:LuxE family acyl-protein synthetase [Mesobacillus zeae]|uniref:LuxE family acyl-protein synthetase n=1 Tax=Mesobacillus zeae TaxID=1917180 RepID=A0A398B317_9BACI|nr:LuxE family acyl-protein synthetase [Mesobacillus zeae]RID82223.1 LuxE family acyl-protein synthetase [Mesobacillus zeae]